jgi:DNA mismatch endonuclease (patch repair protein)
LPASNKDYWNSKIKKNRTRDKKTSKVLKEKGWHVIRIWEHEIKSSKFNRKLNLIQKIAQPRQSSGRLIAAADFVRYAHFHP